MSVRMSYSEFFTKCLPIKHSDAEPIRDTFGAPMNCYGMVYWFYKLCLGIELEKTQVRDFKDIKFIKYERVDVPRDGDIVYMQTPTSLCGGQHIGICINDMVYHFTYEGLRVKSRFKMDNCIKGYYRYVDACQNS